MTLELRDVTKAYVDPAGQAVPILNIPEYRLARGEQVVLVGPSGGGKSTLLNIIAGITRADTGSVRVDNVELTRLPEMARDRFRANRIGYVFQSFHLLPAFTALENVLLGMSFSGKTPDQTRARTLLERVGLGHRLGNRPGQLSVGEQQRVSVARALANSPVLLLADEPTANVDAANQQMVLDLLRQSCEEDQVALLLVTHAQEVARQFSRIDQLKDLNRVGVTA